MLNQMCARTHTHMFTHIAHIHSAHTHPCAFLLNAISIQIPFSSSSLLLVRVTPIPLPLVSPNSKSRLAIIRCLFVPVPWAWPGLFQEADTAV